MPGGAVEVDRWPSARRGAVTFVLAHGAGGSRHDPLLVAVGGALRERGHAVVRFDFLYRALGRKLPDRAPILEATFQAVLARVRAERPRGSGPLIIGGKSMGGRMASRIVAAGEPASGLLLLSYPLHPAKRLSELRTEHLTRIAIPTLFVQGTRDPLCDLSLLRPALATMGSTRRAVRARGREPRPTRAKARPRERERDRTRRRGRERVGRASRGG
ncbi:MAG: alpha/beta fold hydrolase [Polyangiaceae bacterium]|nr:alpha/beta fold hydrolase [Polyangiaceae bacterium]